MSNTPEIDPNDKSKTYVFDGVEVEMTGRTATKPSTLNPKTTITMYEVEPLDKESISWKKWVKLDQLFIIQ